MNTGKLSSQQGLRVSAALGTKQLKKAVPKKLPVAPGSNRKGLVKGQSEGGSVHVLAGAKTALSATAGLQLCIIGVAPRLCFCEVPGDN